MKYEIKTRQTNLHELYTLTCDKTDKYRYMPSFISEIHDEYKIDFNNVTSYQVYRCSGNGITIKTLNDTFNVNHTKQLMLLVTPAHYTWTVVEVGSKRINLPKHASSFYSVTDFNEQRTSLTDFFILIVDRSSINSDWKTKAQRHSMIEENFLYNDLNMRVQYTTPELSYRQFENNGRMLDGCIVNGEKVDIRNYNCYGVLGKDIHYYTLEETIDMSGYCPMAHKRALERKLDVFKEKKVEKLMHYYLAKSNPILEKILNKKNDLLEDIKLSVCYDDLHIYTSKLYCIEKVLEKYENHIDKLTSAGTNVSMWAKYTTIEEVEEGLTYLNIELDKLN